VVVIERNAKLTGLVQQLGLTSITDLRSPEPLLAAIERARPTDTARLHQLASAVETAATSLATQLASYRGL
jgi:hypothetical protein